MRQQKTGGNGNPESDSIEYIFSSIFMKVVYIISFYKVNRCLYYYFKQKVV